jgi:hypothetical protein
VKEIQYLKRKIKIKDYLSSVKDSNEKEKAYEKLMEKLHPVKQNIINLLRKNLRKKSIQKLLIIYLIIYKRKRITFLKKKIIHLKI